MVEVVIKEVEGIKIYLSDKDDYVMNEIWYIVGVTIPSLLVLFMYLLISPIPPSQMLNNIFGFIIAWLSFAFITFMFVCTCCYKTIPSYEIYDRENISSETVHKTNPEEDQIAICKAAKRVEQKILDINQEGKNLEIIASRCR